MNLAVALKRGVREAYAALYHAGGDPTATYA